MIMLAFGNDLIRQTILTDLNGFWHLRFVKSFPVRTHGCFVCKQLYRESLCAVGFIGIVKGNDRQYVRKANVIALIALSDLIFARVRESPI